MQQQKFADTGRNSPGCAISLNGGMTYVAQHFW